MDLADLRANWDAFGREMPIRAILSSCGAEDEAAFFASGRTEVAAVLDELAELDCSPAGPALDFGCGIGRITQALAARFDEVVGVDVAGSMIALAEAHNATPGRCRYAVNAADDLACFPDASFGFVFSTIVLQHVGPKLAAGYVAEFLRVLAPGGIAVFQLPSARWPLPLLAEGEQRAELSLPEEASPAPLRLAPGSTRSFEVAVVNASKTTWTPEHRIWLGSRWLDRSDGSLLVHADSAHWQPLGASLDPGEQRLVRLEVPIPRPPGAYLLQLDLGQPGEAWFADQGSSRIEIDVDVPRLPRWQSWRARLAEGLARPPSEASESDEPLVAVMEMSGIPRPKVEAILERHGGETIAIRPDPYAGPEWESYRYLVRRRAG